MFGSHRSAIKIPREQDTSQHRNSRARRQVARGIIAADKLGFNIEDRILVGAQKRLVAYHGTPSTSENSDKCDMTKWSTNQSQMMMVPMMMGGGSYGGFEGHASHHNVPRNMGGKGKGGKGAKAGGKGKGGMVMQMCQPCGYEDLTWQNPQPAQPCSRCLSKDHYKNQCPYRNHLCEVCNKHGHLPAACRKALGLKACACCGKDNHEMKDCIHKEKTCNTCKKVGRLASVCTAGTADTKKQADSTTTAQATDEAKQEAWCSQCGTFNKLDVKYCTNCKKKRGVEPEKVAKL